MSEYLFDTTTQQFSPVAIAAHGSFWSPDGQSILEFPQAGGRPARLVELAHPETTREIANPLPFKSTTSYYVGGNSPDGRYLVVCEIDASRTPRTLLYDVLGNTATTLLVGPSCARVLGWLPE